MARHRPHLLVPGCDGGQNPLPLDSGTVRHLDQVLRIDTSDVSYTDGLGLFGTGSYHNGLVERGEETRVARPTGLTVAATPPRTKTRVRFVVEKLAELGVRRLVWLRTAHTEGRAPNLDRARSWAVSALEQSRGAWLMEVDDRSTPIDRVAEIGTPIFAVAGGSDPARVILPDDPVVCIGPEGGFASGEVPEGAQRVDLGPTILRVETAAIIAVALLRTREQ
jgi:16S rRNA (uracil1498-N3)-methyltransferase